MMRQTKWTSIKSLPKNAILSAIDCYTYFFTLLECNLPLFKGGIGKERDSLVTLRMTHLLSYSKVLLYQMVKSGCQTKLYRL